MMLSSGPQGKATPARRDLVAEAFFPHCVRCVTAPAAGVPPASGGFRPSHDRFLIHAPEHRAMGDSRELVARFCPDLLNSIPCLPPRSSGVRELPESTQRLWLSGALFLDGLGLVGSGLRS